VVATVSIVFARHEGDIRSIETDRLLRHPAHPCNTLADEEERRRFAAAVSRTTGTGGGDPLAVAAKAYLGDLWALAALGDDMAVRRKALAILGDVAATMAGTEPTGTPRGGVGRTPATTRHRAPGKKA
jgi:hypothetical protein